ncbi:YHS domain protein [Marinilongibacter aquaticus]|uniref:YHS domain-containing (seleno)protein n=1 Tax=Marinilongibacter aquaticus TaxID=2975157 RepID=UPI0021BDD5FE|nr:YHS domain-containing (seleno)protein [Marinilongibacter aquaticus]UBM57885.1 YHS domain protein [Marinilongibacter aquaticus]
MKFSIILLALFASLAAFGQKNIDPTESKIFLDGFDPVSYFEGAAHKGLPSIHFSYKNREYHFESQAHLAQFKANPEHFLPQYEGWCAYAMAKSGDKVKVDPSSFSIYQDKLYLFYKNPRTVTRDLWKADEPRLKIQADKNWTK